MASRSAPQRRALRSPPAGGEFRPWAGPLARLWGSMLGVEPE